MRIFRFHGYSYAFKKDFQMDDSCRYPADMGNQMVVRPFMHVPEILKPLVGLAPNLLSSFLIPFAAYFFFQRFFRLQNSRDLTIACSFGLLLTIINEYFQRIPVFGRTFDYLDIIFSVVGTCIGYFVFARCMQRNRYIQKVV